MQRAEVRSPIVVLVLSLFTCGIYSIWYLFFAVPDEINQGLGREEFSSMKELGLSIVTCGLWTFWYMWRICEALVELQKAWGVEPEMDAAIIFILALLGIGPIFIQMALNNAWENGTPGGAGFGSPDGF
jgi:hypothetical protein